MRGRIIYEEVSNYIENTAAPLCRHLEKIKSQAVSLKVPAACSETLELLKFIVRMKKPSRILELGTGNGLSAASMCFAMNTSECSRYISDSQCFMNDSDDFSCPLLPGGGMFGFKLTTVEKNPDMALLASENLRCFAAEVINCDAASAVAKFAEAGEKFDLVFLDCAKSSYVRLLPGIIKIMNRGAVLAADNVLFKGMVPSADKPPRRYSSIVKNLRSYIAEITEDKRLWSCIMPVGDGLALSVLRE